MLDQQPITAAETGSGIGATPVVDTPDLATVPTETPTVDHSIMVDPGVGSIIYHSVGHALGALVPALRRADQAELSRRVREVSPASKALVLPALVVSLMREIDRVDFITEEIVDAAKAITQGIEAAIRGQAIPARDHLDNASRVLNELASDEVSLTWVTPNIDGDHESEVQSGLVAELAYYLERAERGGWPLPTAVYVIVGGCLYGVPWSRGTHRTESGGTVRTVDVNVDSFTTVSAKYAHTPAQEVKP